jgi:hypothetical protein
MLDITTITAIFTSAIVTFSFILSIRFYKVFGLGKILLLTLLAFTAISYHLICYTISDILYDVSFVAVCFYIIKGTIVTEGENCGV